jgi:hypothetical protein
VVLRKEGMIVLMKVDFEPIINKAQKTIDSVITVTTFVLHIKV